MLRVGLLHAGVVTNNDYSCQIPGDPEHGKWNCDVVKSGDTVCLLQCENNFVIRGSHIVECDRVSEVFDPDPAMSSCAPSANNYVDKDNKFARKIHFSHLSFISNCILQLRLSTGKTMMNLQ